MRLQVLSMVSPGRSASSPADGHKLAPFMRFSLHELARIPRRTKHNRDRSILWRKSARLFPSTKTCNGKRKNLKNECGSHLRSQIPTGTPSKIADYHLDDCFEWIADLECGHQQLVRHNPPWTNRHWVTTPQGRFEHLGFELRCLACPSPFSSIEFL